MKKLIITINTLSAIPGIIIVPLAPFAFFILDGEGRIPGLFHEYAFIAAMIAYPFLLFGGIAFSVFAFKRGISRNAAIIVAALPFLCALFLVGLLLYGGIQLR